jgi:hypothetical protein
VGIERGPHRVRFGGSSLRSSLASPFNPNDPHLSPGRADAIEPIDKKGRNSRFLEEFSGKQT